MHHVKFAMEIATIGLPRRYRAFAYFGTNWQPASRLNRVLCFANVACASYLIPFCGRPGGRQAPDRKVRAMNKFIVYQCTRMCHAHVFFIPHHLHSAKIRGNCKCCVRPRRRKIVVSANFGYLIVVLE